MGRRNYLIEGVSGTGKSSVCEELQRRGYQTINGDHELAYQGDPETGEPTPGFTHEHHIWPVDKVKALAANQDRAATFFCGGSRNFSKFLGLFDGVFVLQVDVDTLNRRLSRQSGQSVGWKTSGADLMAQMHQTEEDIPRNGIWIDATAPIVCVVDEIIRQSEATD